MTRLANGRRRLPRARAALAADATGTMVGALLGTSTVTSYVESTSGIAAGGRSGLTAVVVGLCFAGAAFFSPLVAVVPPEATAPVLLVVAALMVRASVSWSSTTSPKRCLPCSPAWPFL